MMCYVLGGSVIPMNDGALV